ncbi:MAG: hypothetical protein IPN01_32265 [Deltaproteobacteria bacterium]|nr:hypothetical protein [Deltaproteobacteria bacterium]
MAERAVLGSKSHDLYGAVSDLSRWCLAHLKNDRLDSRFLHAFPKPVSEVLSGVINDEKLNYCRVAIDNVRAEASFSSLAPYIDAAQAMLDEVKAAQAAVAAAEVAEAAAEATPQPQPAQRAERLQRPLPQAHGDLPQPEGLREHLLLGPREGCLSGSAPWMGARERATGPTPARSPMGARLGRPSDAEPSAGETPGTPLRRRAIGWGSAWDTPQTPDHRLGARLGRPSDA